MAIKFADKIADKVRLGYIVAFFLLLLSYMLTFYSTREVVTQGKSVIHTTNVINTLDDLLSQLKDGDLSFTGYLIMKDQKFLDEYHKSPQKIDSIIKELRSLSIDDLLRQKRIDTLQKIINKKFTLMTIGITFFNNDGFTLSDSLLKIMYTGKQLMTQARYVVANMQNRANELMLIRTNHVTNISRFIRIINIASLAIAIVLIFYSIITFNKQNQAREQADKKASDFRKALEVKINEMDKLNTELTELRSIEKFAATGRIARTIAHEVRNPLTNINLAAEHLKSEVSPSAEANLLFGMITRNSNRINELISDLLNSTKAAQLTFQNVFINDILNISLDFAKDRIELKQIKVIKNFSENLPMISADTEKLNIAFLNIIVNAIEAMEPKGILTLTTESKNNRCVVTITDTGKGINKEALSKLFEAFYTTKEKGAGLGLTNTQNIILAHNANIYAESNEGRGTAFTVTFNYA